MIPGTFSLNGVDFGGANPHIRVERFDPGQRALTTGDVPAGGHDGRHMGLDHDEGAEWIWDLGVRGERGLGRDPAVTFDRVAALRAAWEGSRDDPGAVDVLRYSLPGRVRRVYGRPRRWQVGDVRLAWHASYQRVAASFVLADPRHFTDDARSVTLSIVPASTGGLKAPLRAPLSTVRSSAPRAGVITAHGDAPAPVTVTFRGPITNPWIRGNGWTIGLAGSLAYDQSVTVDALALTAIRQDGASVGGLLTADTRLRDAALTPGVQQEITFGGTDPTGTATAEITWRDAWWSL